MIYKYNFHLIYWTMKNKNFSAREIDKAIGQMLGISRATIYNYRNIKLTADKKLSPIEIDALCNYAGIDKKDFDLSFVEQPVPHN